MARSARLSLARKSSPTGTCPREPGTVSCSSSSTPLRLLAGRRRTTRTSEVARWTWNVPNVVPPPAIAKVCTTAPGETPCSEAFSRSRSSESRGGAGSSVESTSTTPGVEWNAATTRSA